MALIGKIQEKRNSIATAVFCLGILFFVLGITRGEVEVIWQKAINICLECIGVG